MAKGKFDKDAAFKNIVGVGATATDGAENTDNASNTSVSELPKNNHKNDEVSDKLKQRSYYLTDELLKAITIKTAETELDKSGVVREALKIYLSDILERM